MPAEELLPGLWRVGGGSWNGTVPRLSAEGDANVYLLHRDGKAALVDCGTLEGRAQIEANIRGVGVAPADLGHLLPSHSHWDHSQAAWQWQTSLGLHTHLNATGAAFMAAGDHRLIGYHMYGPPHGFTPFAVDHAIADREAFAAAGVRMMARFMPGHTPDSTVLTFELDGHRVALCGDVAFGSPANGEPTLGLMSLLWLSNLDAYVESLRELAELPVDLLVPGHGAVVAGRDDVRAAVMASLATAERLAGDRAVRTNLGV